MKRTGGLQRTGRLPPVNPERKARKLEKDFGPLADFVREMDCCACGAGGPSDPAHVKSVGAGGHAFLDNGDGDIVPFCRGCHSRQHSNGWSAVPWAGLYGDPSPMDAATSRETARMIAARIGEEFLAQGGTRY